LWAQCQNPDAPLALSFSKLLSDLKGFLATDSAPFPAKMGFSGNTLMASGLAMALAQSVGKMGKKVALVELSPETTLLPYLFHLDVEFGAYDMVSQPKHLGSILTQLQNDAPSAHLTIIPRGTRPLDFNKQSKAIAHWVLDLRQRFDYLIFAMPDWTTHGSGSTPWTKWLGGQQATQKAHLKLLGAMGLKSLLWAEGSEEVQSKTKQADLFKKEQFKTFQKVLPHMVLVRVQEI
ncbi:MAG: hypothetical protein K2X66_11390, partial [Cyanobacteria bacterium]|nr:hypothetical protein [Cyanobacteriota bacterium]